jgi:hypothetical protein
MIRMTRTYAILPVSPAAYAEVRAALEAAGYQHAFHREGGEEVIDMQGIALQAIAPTAAPSIPVPPPLADHSYLSAGENRYASGDRAYVGCSLATPGGGYCGRSRSEHPR